MQNKLTVKYIGPKRSGSFKQPPKKFSG